MRAVLFLFILANLAYFAWARFIDLPAAVPNDSLGRLERLELLREARPLPPGKAAPVSAQASGASSGAAPSAGAGAAREVGPGSTGGPAQAPDAQPSIVPAAAPAPRHSPAPPAAPASGRVDRPAGRKVVSVDRCATSGYWVFIGGLRSPSAAERVLRRLERHGLADAKIMPAANETGRTVSEGLFSRRDDARHRAQAVRRLGLDAEIEGCASVAAAERPGAGRGRT